MIEEYNNNLLYRRQKAFIETLRKEASEAKSCVTQYSFQCLAISGAALGVIFNNSKDNPMSSLASIPLIILLMIMARIAIYKYELANRACGYEFYLKMTMALIDKQDKNFKEDINSLKFVAYNEHWEQTFFAWRTISPTLFRKFYRVGYQEGLFSLLNPNAYKPKFSNEDNPWILVPNRIDAINKVDRDSQKEVVYFPGSYLGNVLMMLTMMQWLLIAPLIIAACREYISYSMPNSYPLSHSLFNVISLAIVIVTTTIFIWIRRQRIDRRRQIIEAEIFSIRTTSKTWSLVVKVHYLSWLFAEKEITEMIKTGELLDPSTTFLMTKKYEDNLNLCAELISINYDKPDNWKLTERLKNRGN
jgi:hypothetical protein